MKIYKLLSILLMSTLIIWSCTNKKEEVVRVDENFNNLFSPDSGGITGADGIFSIELSDGKSVFLTGDCFLGKVVNGRRDPHTKMLNNSLILINKEQTEAKALYKGIYDNPSSFIVPKQDGKTKRWYWPGHGFVENDTLYMFALNLYNEEAAMVKSGKKESEKDQADKLAEMQWSFRVSGIDFLSFKLPDFEHIKTEKVDCTYGDGIHFGNNVLVEGKYVYFYGTKSESTVAKAYVARTELGKKPYHKNWEFYDGSQWVKDYDQSKPLDIDVSVSEQFTVSRVKDKYIFLTQERGLGMNDIYTYTSSSPFKNFSNKTLIYRTPDLDTDTTKKLFTYNAMAHPQYIKDGALLVSYCINSFQVRDVFDNVNNYRPRFIRIPLKNIDPAL